MSLNQAIVEVVRFTSSGVPEILAQTKGLNKAADDAAGKYKTLLGVVNNPGFPRYAALMDRLAKSTEIAGLKAQNMSLAYRLADGSAARQLRTVTQLTAKHEQMRRQLELTARYGDRVGGFLAKHGAKLEAARNIGTYATTAALATGGALVHQGFQGTVESARLGAEWTLLSRELAGAFKPAIDVTTKAVRGLRTFMERLGPAGQNVVMFGGLAATGALALKTLGGGGLLAMAARGVLTGGGAAAAQAAAAAGGTAAGNAASRVAGGGAAGGAGGAASGAGPVGLAMAAAVATFFASRYAEHEIATGDGTVSRFNRAALRHTRHMLVGGDLAGNPLDAYADKVLGGPGGTRSAVTLAGGGFEETGSGYDRIASAIEKVKPEEEAKGEDKSTSILEDIRDFLGRLLGDRGSEPTRPGG